jgi:hypothetical protein
MGSRVSLPQNSANLAARGATPVETQCLFISFVSQTH